MELNFSIHVFVISCSFVFMSVVHTPHILRLNDRIKRFWPECMSRTVGCQMDTIKNMYYLSPFCCDLMWCVQTKSHEISFSQRAKKRFRGFCWCGLNLVQSVSVQLFLHVMKRRPTFKNTMGYAAYIITNFKCRSTFSLRSPIRSGCFFFLTAWWLIEWVHLMWTKMINYTFVALFICSLAHSLFIFVNLWINDRARFFLLYNNNHQYVDVIQSRFEWLTSKRREEKEKEKWNCSRTKNKIKV